MNDDTIIQLQELVAHQGDDIAQLSDELYKQQKEMLLLGRQIAALQARLQASAEDSGVKPLDQESPPPHY